MRSKLTWNVVEAKRKTLIEKLDQVCDLVTNIDDALASAQEELVRVQAIIEALKATREVQAVEGSTLESKISMISSTIDCLRKAFVK